MAKGMEFRYVVVDPDEMTENDKYIAYTRAMEKLYIVEEQTDFEKPDSFYADMHKKIRFFCVLTCKNGASRVK